MELSDLVKYLINNKKEWLREITKSDKNNPIIYLNDYKDLEEYKILHFLAKNNILEERENKLYSSFTITKEGIEHLAKFEIRYKRR